MKTFITSFSSLSQSLFRFSMFLLLLAAATLAACKKDGEEAKPDDKALLTANPWMVTAATADGIDAFSSQAACNKDDLFRFNQNGSYTLEEGATKCNAGDAQIFAQGTWTFDESTRVLTMNQSSGAGFSGQAKVTELTSSKMTIEYNGTFNGVTRKVVQQFVPGK